MKITITDISESDLGTQIAIMNVDNPTKITKIKQGNGLWTIIGEFQTILTLLIMCQWWMKYHPLQFLP